MEKPDIEKKEEPQQENQEKPVEEVRENVATDQKEKPQPAKKKRKRKRKKKKKKSAKVIFELTGDSKQPGYKPLLAYEPTDADFKNFENEQDNSIIRQLGNRPFNSRLLETRQIASNKQTHPSNRRNFQKRQGHSRRSGHSVQGNPRLPMEEGKVHAKR